MVQTLEPRQLLAANPVGPEFQVNTFTTGSQFSSAVAMDADGDSVVTWSSYGDDSGYGIFAQRYNAAGVAQGSEFRVNTFTTNQQFSSAVAMDADGDFVVKWESNGQDGSGYGIFAQRYNAAGVAQGSEFRVNTFTTGDQRISAVAMDADGDFVVTWESRNQDGSFYGVYAQRYNAAGVAQGGEFQVNTFTTADQRLSAVAMDADGDFVVTWSSVQDGSSTGIYAQRYNAAGVAQGGEFQVNTFTTGNQNISAVAMDADGDFVVTWSSLYQDLSGYGVYAQRYNAAGVAQGSEFRVNTFTTDQQVESTVAMDADGDFVISWQSFLQDGSSDGIYAQRYNAAGATLGSEFQVNTFTTNRQQSPSVAMDADGDFVVTWESRDQDGGSKGIFAQRYDDTGPDDADDAGPTVTGVYPAGLGTDPDDMITTAEVLRANVTGIVVTFSEALIAGTVIPAAFRLLRNGVDVSALITGATLSLNASGKYQVSLTLSAPLSDGAYKLKALSTITDLFGNKLDGANNDGGFSEDFSQTFTIARQIAKGNEISVNTFTTGAQVIATQSTQAVATNADGDFVVVWQSDGLDGSNFSVSGRLYNAAGVPQGPGSEFQVNTTSTNAQDRPAVAMDAAGNFVVTWTSTNQAGDDGSGVYARRYNSAGSALTGELHVNTHTTNNQFSSSIAMDADGDFVITWTSNLQDGSGVGVYGQRYNAAGVAQGGEFQVHTTTTDRQEASSVAMDADGDFVVTWSNNNPGGSGYDVFAQRYNAAGARMGGEFLVNTFTTGTQWTPTIDLDADGDFVIAWTATTQEAGGYGIYAQRYNALGQAQGSEFHVNTFTTDIQKFQRVGMDADGDFAIVWQSNTQDGSNNGIYGQRYNAAGVAQGSEFQVNNFTTGNQQFPGVAMDADGDFVVAWTSPQDGDGDGIRAQRFQATTRVVSVTPGGSSDPIEPDEKLVSSIPASLVLQFDRPLNLPAGAIAANVLANFSVTVDGINAPVLAGTYNPAQRTITLTFAAPITEGHVVLTYTDTQNVAEGQAIDGDANGTPGGDFVLAFDVFPSVPAGNEFRVNTFTTGAQRTFAESPQSVAVDEDGDYIVTWSSNGQDGSGYGIYVQRYNAAGVAQGSEFQVNTFTTGHQAFSTVAMDADGDFVVTWSSNGQDGSGYGIYAQRYNAAGVAQGSEFQVNTFTTGLQAFSTVAMDADGDFVVTWSSYGQDGSNFGIYAQRYNAAGVAQGTEFQVNAFTTSAQRSSTVAMDADGDFVVAWQSYTQDGSAYGVYAQRYNAAGVAQGTEFQVNTFTTDIQNNSTVAVDADGDFVVTWSSYGQDGSNFGIYAQRYNAAGVAQGTEFQVNAFTTSTQRISSVAMDADGDFVVAWQSITQDGSTYGVYAQRYNAAGVAQGGEFQVNTFTAGNQRSSTVAMDADGDFVVVWSSNGQDGSGYGVYAQRFDGRATTNVSILAGNLVVTDIHGGDTNDTLTITADNTNSVFLVADPNQILRHSIVGASISDDRHTVTVPYALVTGVEVFVDTHAGDDSVTINAVGGAGTFGKGLFLDTCDDTDVININSTVDAGNAAITLFAETINLAGNLTTDGGEIDVLGEDVILQTNVTLDTETGDDDVAGLVILMGNVAGDTNTRSLTIDASFNGLGGDVLVVGDFSTVAGTRLQNVTISSAGFADIFGSIDASQDVTLTARDVDILDATIHAGGTATLKPVGNGILIDLGTETVGRFSLTDDELDNVTASKVVIGSTTAGAIIQTTTLSQAGKTLELITGSNMTRTTGEIEADKLTLRAAAQIGDAVVRMRTNVNNLEAQSNGSGIFITEANAVTIGGASGALAGFSTTAGNGAISLITGNAITVSENIVANGSGAINLHSYFGDIALGADITTTGNASVVAGAAISRTAGTIAADQLTLDAQTSIGAAANPGRVRTSVNRLEAIAKNVGIFVTETNALEIGGIANGLAQGLQTTAGSGAISLVAGNAITVSESIVANGSGGINLHSYFSDIALGANVATTGNASLVAGAAISRTAGTIAADQLTLDAQTSIGAATGPARIHTNAIRLEAIAKNGGIFVTETNNVEIGGIANGLTRGLETTGGHGHIELLLNAGALTIVDGIRTHGNGVTRLRAAGNVTQTGNLGTMGGIVSAALGVVSDTGTVNLSADANDVNHLAAAAVVAGKSVYFRDADDLYTNQVAAGGVFAAAVTGVTAGHDVELKANKYLAAERPIQAGSGANDTVRLQSETNAVGQTAQGTITARNLSVQAGAAINLPANNDVDVFAAAAGVGPVIFNDPDGKTNGTVPGGVLITNSVTGVTP